MRLLSLALVVALIPLTAQAEDKETKRELDSLFRQASFRPAAEVLEQLAKYSDEQLQERLVKEIGGRTPGRRRVAIAEAGRRKLQAAELALAEAAVADSKSALRQAANEALAALPKQEQAGAWFAKQIVASPKQVSLSRRMRAVGLAGQHPVAAAVPGMIRLLKLVQEGGGGPLVHFTKIEQRAYIKDVEVNQTGVIPVLNPQIGVVNSGSVLEAKVIYFVRETTLKVLRGMTGQGFGSDPAEWEQWWGESRDTFTPRRPSADDE